MPDKTVYRSTHPDVLAAVAAFDAKFRAYREAVNAALEAAGVGRYRIWAATSGFRPGQFTGLDIPAGEEPPPGWRMKGDYAVPDRRRAAGKRIAAALKAIRHPGDPMASTPGMPPDVLTARGFSTPGLNRMDGALWVIWGTDPEIADGSFSAKSAEVDRALWERVPLSVYYAAREAAEDAEVTADA